MQLDELYLDRFLYRDTSQEARDASAVSADSTPEEPTPIPSGGAAQDINTGNTFIKGNQIEPGTIPSAILDVSNWGWGQTCAFASASSTTVTWGAGVFTSAGGETYAISAGSTGAMSAKTYIFLDLNVSSTAYQTTTVSADSVGIGKVLIAVAQNAATGATFNLSEASQIVGDNILANTIDASKLNVGQLSAITANIGTITSGTITGTTIRTANSGARVELLGSNNEINIHDGSVRRARGYQSGWSFFNTSGDSVADIYAGTTALGTRSLLLTAAGSSTGSLYLESGSTGTVGMYVNGTAYLTASGSSGVVALNRNLVPVGTRSLGNISAAFDSVWTNTLAYNGTLEILSSGIVDIQGLIRPSATNTYDVGTSARRWRDLYINNVLIRGAGYYVDFNSGYADNIRAIYFETGRTTNPNISGQMNFFDGTTKGFRGRIATFTGQFDLSSV